MYIYIYMYMYIYLYIQNIIGHGKTIAAYHLNECGLIMNMMQSMNVYTIQENSNVTCSSTLIQDRPRSGINVKKMEKCSGKKATFSTSQRRVSSIRKYFSKVSYLIYWNFLFPNFSKNMNLFDHIFNNKHFCSKANPWTDYNYNGSSCKE